MSLISLNGKYNRYMAITRCLFRVCIVLNVDF